MNSAHAIVDRLLESDDPKDSIFDIIDREPGEEFMLGFGIDATVYDDADLIGLDSNAVTEALLQVEHNALHVLNYAGLGIQSEGHDDSELVGTCWVTFNGPGFYIIQRFAEQEEPYSTSSGSIWQIPGMQQNLFSHIPADLAGIIDVSIRFFGLDRFKEATEEAGV